MPCACAIAVKKDGAARPSVTVATPSRMKSRRDTVHGRSFYTSWYSEEPTRRRARPGGSGVELLATAAPRPGGGQYVIRRLLG